MDWIWWVVIGIGVLAVFGAMGNQSRSYEPPMIIIGSARRSPTLTPELEQYVKKLVGIYNQHRGLKNGPARAVGEEIHKSHGHEAMVDVCDTVRNRVGDTGYRELEVCWSGIGHWQG